MIVVNCTINTSQYNEYIQLALGMTVLFELLLLTCGNYYSSCSDKKVSLQCKNLFESTCSSMVLVRTYCRSGILMGSVSESESTSSGVSTDDK